MKFQDEKKCVATAISLIKKDLFHPYDIAIVIIFYEFDLILR